ncbi:uncharacterized protein LOC126837690, partial [Adelges cooleyi]|uniref:uncharacterized protein LOC126837690 n=1 Tax=Adelges cooleyi TaxID=133065 RepID=UPI00217F615B
MMNIKIIILLSLAAFASCGSNDSEEGEASYMDLDLPEASSSTNPELGIVAEVGPEASSSTNPKLEIVAEFQNLQLKGKSDDEIIEDVFKDCREWFSRNTNDILIKITEDQFCKYMKNSVDDYGSVMVYLMGFKFTEFFETE